MAPHGTCRVCGAPSVGTMPCRRCAGLILERDSETMPTLVRWDAALELKRIIKRVSA